MSHPFRITMASGKFGAVIAAGVIILLVGLIGAMVDFCLGFLAAVVLTVALVVLPTRLYRGASESPAPLAWWQLTATPAIGYVPAALFLVQGVSIMVAVISGAAPAVVWVGAAVSVALAAAFIHSSVRLSALGARGSAPTKP